MSVITLCGSTRFKDTFMKAAQDLTLDGHIVLMPNVFHHIDMPELTAEQKDMLDTLHKKKIDMSDCIVIIDDEIDGQPYLGRSTRNERLYANMKNKPVYYWSEING